MHIETCTSSTKIAVFNNICAPIRWWRHSPTRELPSVSPYKGGVPVGLCTKLSLQRVQINHSRWQLFVGGLMHGVRRTNRILFTQLNNAVQRYVINAFLKRVTCTHQIYSSTWTLVTIQPSYFMTSQPTARQLNSLARDTGTLSAR